MVRVLFVEDEAEVADVMSEAMREVGLSVTVAHDDRTAFATLNREARSFAAVVTDVNLGLGVTGFDVARRARELHAEIKVAYFTGDDASIERFGVPGAVTILKPVAPAELARTVSRLVS